MVKKFDDMITRFDKIHEREIARQTDGQTDTERLHRPGLCIASRGKNGVPNITVYSHSYMEI